MASLKQLELTKAEWREHWPTGVASLLGLGLGQALLPNIASLFIEPLHQSYGWTRGQISLVHNASLISAFLSPVAGRIIDRSGARPFILGGFILMGALYVALSVMQGSIGSFYLLYGGLYIAGVATAGLGFSKVISAAFVHSRGFSLAVGRSGLAISATFLPSLLFSVISAYGWRAGFAMMGGLTLLIALPVTWLCIERRSGLRKIQPSAAEAQSWRSLLTNRKVIAISLAAALAYAPIIGITTQLQPLLVNSGIPPPSAAWIVGLMGASSFVGLVITGILLDRFWAPLIAITSMTLAAIGALFMLFGGHIPFLAALGVLLLGLAYGAETDLVAFIIGRYFGMGQFSAIYGIMIFAISISMAIGSTGIGLIYDHVGSYQPSLIIAAVMLMLSGLVYLTLGRYPDQTE